ncbi:MAG TPA: hypothetical protein VF299_10035 [Mycobacterium sp.]
MKKTMTAVVCAVVSMVLFPASASADPTTDAVCTGFRVGMSQSEIAQRLRQNDGRITPQQAWQDTNWPILEGQCDN